jgi:drug/metabolite transporter (DMT)-like permease
MLPSRVLRADAMLLIVALIWGVGFVVQKTAMDGDDPIGPMSFSASRLLLGGLVLLPLLLLGKPLRPARVAPLHLRRRAVLMAGVLLAAGAILQQWGLVYTEAGVAGFVTGLYVVFVPLLGLCIGYRVHGTTWVAAVLALLGMYLLSVSGRGGINPGDLLVLGGAVCWAAQVLVIGWIVPVMDPMRLAIGQNLVGGVLATIAALLFETPTLSQLSAVAWELAYSGPLAIGLAFFLQILAQRDAPPAHTAILLAMEAVFGALAGWALLHEHFTTAMLWGCGAVVLAMLVAQWKSPAKMPTASALF